MRIMLEYHIDLLVEASPDIYFGIGALPSNVGM